MMAAIGYQQESGIKLRFGLIRSDQVGRTFIEPEPHIRSFGVRLKLSPVKCILEGQRVILVDDSIVRGTTSKKIVRMIRDAGAREIHLRISSPPIQWSCFYGIDTPDRNDLIAAHMGVDQIRYYLEVDSLGYLSLDATLAACGLNTKTACTACWSGLYPTKVPPITQITRQ